MHVFDILTELAAAPHLVNETRANAPGNVDLGPVEGFGEAALLRIRCIRAQDIGRFAEQELGGAVDGQ